MAGRPYARWQLQAAKPTSVAIVSPVLGITDDNRKWWIMSAMGGVIGLILLDETVVGVALPTIRRDLSMSLIGSHWVVNVYLLVFAGLAAAGGKLGDILGHRNVFLAGVTIFGLSSLAAGFAQDGVWIISARAVQGVGAAVIFPCSLSMIAIVFPEHQRGVAIGISGCIGTVFLALGPLVGGFFTDVVDWSWIFWINPILVVVVALVVAMAWVNPPRQGASARIDYVGLICLATGLGMVVFAIMQGAEWGWDHPTVLTALLGGVVMLAIFVLAELRIRAPLIEVDLFRNATFTACNLVIFTAQFSKIAVIIFGALYLQHALGMNPLLAGLALMPAVVPTPFTAPVAGRCADRYGARWPALIGVAVEALAMIWIGVATGWNNYWLILPALLAWGVVQPLLFAPPQRAIMNTVPPHKQGQAGGICMTAQLLGGTIGMSICSTLFATTGEWRYSAVFLVTGAVMLATGVLGLFTIEHRSSVESV